MKIKKEQLINELAELRQRIDELKKSEALHKLAEEQPQRDLNQIERRVEKRIDELTRKNGELNQEIAECKKTEKTLKASEKKYSAIVENSPDIIYILDPAGKFSFVGGAIGSLLGYTAEELKGNHFTSIIWPEDVKKAEWRVNERRTGDRSTKGFEVRLITKRGKGKHFDIKYLPVELYTFGAYDKHVSANDKKFLGTYGAARDITTRKQAQDKLTASLKEKEVLLKEIHHRVKNNLQVISSMLSLQSQHIKDKDSLAMFQESQDRIRAMALIHENLYTSEDLSYIDIASYIHSLTRQLITTYSTASSRVGMNIAITDIFLTITTAIPCGLIINELVTNALKHAFPHQQKGTITVSMTPSTKDSLILTVSDTGIGFPKEIDFRNTTTLGMQLVTSLVEQLDGTITLDRRKGTTFTITFRGGVPV